MKVIQILSKHILFLFVFSIVLHAEVFNESDDIPAASTTPPFTLTPGDSLNASISDPADFDMIKLDVPANTSFVLEIKSTTEDFDVYSTLYQFNNGGYQNQGIHAYDVDGFNPRSMTLDGGTNGRTYYLYISDYQVCAGDYTVTYTQLNAINTREFTKVSIAGVKDLNLFGSALMIGNQLICLNDQDGGECREPNIGATNNAIAQHKAKVDPNGPSSNSMAKLVLEPGDEIVWAGLYWSARINTGAVGHPDAANIQMRIPGATGYSNITSDANKFDWYSDGAVFDYACMQDVTDEVKAGGAGEYYVGGIKASGGVNTFAAWALMVIVENNSRDFKNISVYDGFQAVYDGGNYPRTVDVVASGFLTPKTGDVNSSLFVFTGESESGIDDGARITDKDGTAHIVTDAYNDNDDLFNGSVSILGEHRSEHADPNIANPNFQNLAGTDIDIIEVTELSNFQTSTTISIESKNGNRADRYSLNMFALETELYTPRFCYDYAYEQNGVDFTEENDATKNPFIVGSGLSSEPVDVKIYLKNLVDSDITITDLSLNILGIDTTQVKYKSNSISLTPIGGVFPYQVSDSILDTTNASEVLNIPVGDMDSNDHIYLYYSLNPQASSLNTPLMLEASYTLTIGGESIPYATRIGERIEMCSDSNFKYEPIKGIFSIVDNNYYNYEQGGAARFYNLPTQVVNRPTNLKLVSFDEDDLDEPKPISTIVAVELLDGSGFHDIQHTCTEQNASVSGRTWIIFNQQSSVDFPALFPLASKNATFRISYNNMSDTDDDIVQTELLSNGNYKMINFPYLAGESCVKPTPYPLGASYGTATYVSEACGDAGDQGISKEHLDACMECIYGKRTAFVCSRDNFSIRPEAFNMLLRDTNEVQANTIGVAIPNASANANANLAAGYSYDVLIDAVTHSNDNPSIGYNGEFSETVSELDASGDPVIRQAQATDPNFYGFNWTPGTQDVSGCNDIQDHSLATRFTNGQTNQLVLLDEVGIYTYLIQDSLWTTVDQLPSHHTNSFFTGDFDCLDDESLVQTTAVNSTDMAPNNYDNFLNGCQISSDHTNVDRGTVYNDYLIEFHPYTFNASGIIPTVGLNNLPLNNNTGFVYMADVGNNNLTPGGTRNRDMSVHLNGTIVAEGNNGVALSNFVDNCYAKPLDIDLSDMVYAPAIDTNANPISYQYRLITQDDQDTQLNDSGAIVYDPTIAYTPGMANIPSLSTNDFAPTAQGQTDTTLLLNYGRQANAAVNPQQITFNNYNVQCQTPANCTFTADMDPNAVATGTQNINANVTHYYARSFTPRQSYTAFVGNAPIFYESYCDVNNGCDTTLLQGTNVSQGGDTRWRINQNHTNNHGTVPLISQKNALNVTSSAITLNSATLTYNNNRGRPYTATMQHQADGWLIYNPYDVNAITNEFEAEFIGGNSNWAGDTDTTDNTQTDASQRSNRKLVW